METPGGSAPECRRHARSAPKGRILFHAKTPRTRRDSCPTLALRHPGPDPGSDLLRRQGRERWIPGRARHDAGVARGSRLQARPRGRMRVVLTDQDKPDEILHCNLTLGCGRSNMDKLISGLSNAEAQRHQSPPPISRSVAGCFVRAALPFECGFRGVTRRDSAPICPAPWPRPSSPMKISASSRARAGCSAGSTCSSARATGWL